METYYLIILGVLFILAFSDLIVGVSNDAVNFLNAAVGSKAGSFKLLVGVAGLGILIGCTFSSGMMEVARKGIFHPEHYLFSDLMLLFLAVMIADVILLDTFNTFGLPTSTTVSVVFELLGAAVAIAMIKSFTGQGIEDIGAYINSGKALAIISGILLSVVVAFTTGAIVQYLVRMAFSFDSRRWRISGPVWGGLSAAAISYFMVVKGAKGASWMSADTVAYVNDHWLSIVAISFVAWTIILTFLHLLFKANLLRIIVLMGTFALAMAFAGNDLVNFIGVPLAGYNSYEIWVQSNVDPAALSMEQLAGKVPTPTLILALAGLVMGLTLWFSKKAKTVVKTSVDLGRQYEGYERFNSFAFSRSIVRNFGKLAMWVNDRLPGSLKRFIEKQFDPRPFNEVQKKLGKDAPSFDLVRASSTLVVASILIAIGTNLKLPLSTTYVTFMVFMGTSLADGAWGRESAVYRVSGVLSVIGGWFFTAMSAFIIAFVLACILYFGGMVAIAIVIAIAIYLVYRSHRIHDKREAERLEFEKSEEVDVMTRDKILGKVAKSVQSTFESIQVLLGQTLQALANDDLKTARDAFKGYQDLEKKAFKLKSKATKSLDQIDDDQIEAAHLYILIAEYIDEMTHIVRNLVKPSFEHIDNTHKPLLPQQIRELEDALAQVSNQMNLASSAIAAQDTEALQKLNKEFSSFVKYLRSSRKAQIKRIKNHEVGTRNSILYFNHLGEFRNLSIYINRMAKVFEDLVINEGAPMKS